jgi:UDP-N-acetylmuramate--alanine ligase
LYSRTQDLAVGFAENMDLADCAVLLPIYPARELPIKGVSSAMIYDLMKLEDKILMEKSEVIDGLKEMIEKRIVKSNKSKWVIITAGAGDIDTMLPQLKEIILNGF